MKKDVAKLLEFGAGGHTLHLSSGQGYSNCTCSGYEDPESFVKPYHWWADPAEKMSVHWHGYTIPEEGIPVIDVRETVENDFGYRWVFKGPLLDVDLQEGEIDRLPEVSALMIPAVAAYGQIGALADTILAKKENRAGALDSVGISEYVNGWREHGARIGRFYVENEIGRIEWEA